MTRLPVHPYPPARKRFGQNFLHDPGIIAQIIQAIQPRPHQYLVEIGPGRGALTGHLLQQAGVLTAIELDRDLINPLQQQNARYGTLHIIQQDVLTVDFTQLAPAGKKLRIVGNLPYNISTPLLFHLFQALSSLEDIHVMLQKEVVERMAATPGHKTWGRLSMMTQYYCQVFPLLPIPPHCFTPAPKVDSRLVRLIPHTTPPVQITAMAVFQQLMTQAFSQRRKTLSNALYGLFSAEQLRSLEVNPQWRAEQLDLETFARLANAIADKIENTEHKKYR